MPWELLSCYFICCSENLEVGAFPFPRWDKASCGLRAQEPGSRICRAQPVLPPWPLPPRAWGGFLQGLRLQGLGAGGRSAECSSGHGAQHSGQKPNADDVWAAGVSNSGGGVDNREGLPCNHACWPGAGYRFPDSIPVAAHTGCPAAMPRVMVRGTQWTVVAVPTLRWAVNHLQGQDSLGEAAPSPGDEEGDTHALLYTRRP